MDAHKRYALEREYWDKHAARIWAAPSDYKLPHLATFEDLCRSISYLSPVSAFFGHLRGKRILDLACGDGWISWSLGKSGAIVHGCDISPKSIEIARRFAGENGLQSTVTFDVMACEQLSYEDNYFDLAIMHAAMHHCDIDKTSEQLHRVLKPGSKAVLIEDYAYHPLMRLYRILTPDRHTETEEALTDEDLQVIVRHFSGHFFGYFGILNLVETSSSALLRRMKPLLRALDSYLYAGLPSVRKYSKLIEIFLIK